MSDARTRPEVLAENGISPAALEDGPVIQGTSDSAVQPHAPVVRVIVTAIESPAPAAVADVGDTV